MNGSKLFMFYVGGDFANANIELHDVRFSIGNAARDCYADLRSQWWGNPSSLHIDSWLEVSQVDGYDIALSEEPFRGPEKLYFLNFGGYTEQDFEEVHKNVLVVATSQRNAIQRTKQAHSHWTLPHKDSLLELEKAVSVSDNIQTSGTYIHLNAASEIRPQVFTNKYIRLAR